MSSRQTRGLMAAAGDVAAGLLAALGWVWAAAEWAWGELRDALRYERERRRRRRSPPGDP